MKVRILGGGESGIGAALLANKLKFDVFLSDFGEILKERREELEEYNIPFEEKGHDFDILKQADVIIKSPGISDNATIIQKLLKEGIEIISEIEFAFRHQHGKVIAITGSNGKTTTTHLIYFFLRNAGFDVAEVGNVGKSFARQLFEEEKEYYVVEVSSFQLDGIKSFKPDVAVLLNISSDHLDRYDYNEDKYAASKFRISENQNKNDFLILNGIDTGIIERMDNYQFLANITRMVDSDILPDGKVRMYEDATLDIAKLKLMGRHNQMNVWAALQVMNCLGIEFKSFDINLNAFINDPHRLELVGDWNGVKWINDSKATNIDSTFYALEAMKEKVIWIAGGTDKGNDYEVIKELVQKKVKTLICLGIDNKKLKESFSEVLSDLRETQSIREAVKWAKLIAKKGDTVLLSPACASFDLFKNYKDRGDRFKEEVEKFKSLEV